MLLVGRQKGHPACKKWGDGGGGHWLVRMEWRPPGLLMCLPLLIFPKFPCTTKSRSCLLAPAHTGGPGKSAVKRLRWRFGVLLAAVHERIQRQASYQRRGEEGSCRAGGHEASERFPRRHPAERLRPRRGRLWPRRRRSAGGPCELVMHGLVIVVVRSPSMDSIMPREPPIRTPTTDVSLPP